MLAAGLDFVLPVYWGEPGHPGRTTGPTSPHYWSTEGIPAMVEALDRNRGRGAPPLQIGMFYDTTILANADLTTAAGKEYFYINVRDFYSRIPPRYWAAIDSKPIVWLYDTIWISEFDQSSLDYLSERFAQDFGGLRLFIVRESQWQAEQGRRAADARSPATGCTPGAPRRSASTPRPELTIAEVGPGFKNTQYCTGGPETELLRHRPPGRRAATSSSCSKPWPAAATSWPPRPGTSSAKAPISRRRSRPAASTSTSPDGTSTSSRPEPDPAVDSGRGIACHRQRRRSTRSPRRCATEGEADGPAPWPRVARLAAQRGQWLCW